MKLFNAIRDLDIERSAREMDEKMHRQEVAAYLREIEELRHSNTDLQRKLSEHTVIHKEESSDLKKLKEEYQLRYEEKRLEFEDLLRKYELQTNELTLLDTTSKSRLNRIDELENESRTLRNSQTVTDKQLRETEARMNAAISMSSISEESRQRLDFENCELKRLLSAKEIIVDGLQRALNAAQEKINGIAVLKDHVRSVNRR